VESTTPIPIQNPWLQLLGFTEPPEDSERLIRALEAHTAAEERDIADCEQVAQHTEDPIVELLTGLVAENERRNQSLIRRMIRRLHEEFDSNSSTSPPASQPVPSREATADSEATVVGVRGLIRDEHEGARYLRHLARQEPNLYGGLYAVLLEGIARDGEKHAFMLRYLLRRLEGRKRAE
jgi:hypothetical protein